MKLACYGELAKDKVCGFCDTKLVPKFLEYYDHPDGWQVEGFHKKQWLYITCHRCGHQWSFIHLGIKRGGEVDV